MIRLIYFSIYLIGNKFFDIIQGKNIARCQQEAFHGTFKNVYCVIAFHRAVKSIERSSDFEQFSFSHAMARSERKLSNDESE